MYVTDSLFFIQHLLGGDHNEKHAVFSYKYREIIEGMENPVSEEDAEEQADEIINRMVEKSKTIRGIKDGI